MDYCDDFRAPLAQDGAALPATLPGSRQARREQAGAGLWQPAEGDDFPLLSFLETEDNAQLPPWPPLASPGQPSLAEDPFHSEPVERAPLASSHPFARSNCSQQDQAYAGSEATAQPSPSPSATNSIGSDQESEADKGTAGAKQRKKRLAEACRRFRARRKEEVAQLKRKNETLEGEREELLSRIAQLQTEVQAFRDHGAVDLARENSLLRSEIRLHKRFIMTIANATRMLVDIPDEERFRVLLSGLNSAVGQCVGLCYTSSADESWTVAKPFYVEGQGYAYVRIQVLPLGCADHEMKRINMRLDMPGRTESFDELYGTFYNLWLEEEPMIELVGNFFPELSTAFDFSFEELCPKFRLWEDSWEAEKLRLFRGLYSEKDGQTYEIINLIGEKRVRLAHSAFPESVRAAHDMDETTALEATMVTCTATDAVQEHASDYAPSDPSVMRLTGTMIDSFIITPMPDGTSVVSIAASYPCSTQALAQYFSFVPPLIDEEGELCDVLKRLSAATLNVFGPPPGTKPKAEL
eukprot:CAMPEP_0202072190 /NCGR_PEP_ID=MMETSP0964-20121228/2278_1 /ASSEMBLY_ACC=CAM_ASM_000500 /TAXON_ID=4773 /ORGANISM="Schizochytrium aggregatum, Strain ATCC28209" /LENGTH=523 /DNA_ID=CAMNT_0048639211 /DNA_START=125 /DNA_END=1696 /DNA_ORIENTATION=+